MKGKKFTQGMTVFVEPSMYQLLKRESDVLEISISELFRNMINLYFDEQQKCQEDYSGGNSHG